MDESLAELGRYLLKGGYKFTAVTPDSHRRVLQKNISATDPLRELFGWNKAVARERIPDRVLSLLLKADLATEDDEKIRSRVRFATLGDRIFVHSPYPTSQRDAVFFGPDSYRFVEFIGRYARPVDSVVDIGGGSGVGGICLADRANDVLITDINERALAFTAINARVNDARVETRKCDLFDGVPPGYQTVIANPPFIMDPEKRSYRDGGDHFGTALSQRILEGAVDYLPAGGQLLLYTATCFVDGRDIFFENAAPVLRGLNFEYREIDPDIFGEELSLEAYRRAERIAAVGLVLRKQ